MSAQAPPKRRGRKHPPRENLLGRTAVRRLLHCALSTLASLHDRGELVPDIVDADGSRWYTLESVLAFAETWNERRKKLSKKAYRSAPTKARTTRAPVASTPTAPTSDYNPDPVRRGVKKTSQHPAAERGGSLPAATAVSERDPSYNPDPMRREVLTPSPVADAPTRTERVEGIPSLETSGVDRFGASYVPLGGYAPASMPSPPPAAPPPTPAPTRGRVPASIKSTMVINPAWFNEDYQPPPSER